MMYGTRLPVYQKWFDRNSCPCFDDSSCYIMDIGLGISIKYWGSNTGSTRTCESNQSDFCHPATYICIQRQLQIFPHFSSLVGSVPSPDAQLIHGAPISLLFLFLTTLLLLAMENGKHPSFPSAYIFCKKVVSSFVIVTR